MAKIPSTADLGLGPGPQPTLAVAQVNPTSGAEGAIGQALSSAGTDLQGASAQVLTAYRQEEERTDTIKVEDAWNKYRTTAMGLTSGPNGVLATKGADAVNGDLLKRVEGPLADARKQIFEGLNERQRERFAQRADVTDLTTAHQVLEHLTTQQNEYSKTTFQGSEAAARSQVSAAPTDPGVFKGALDTLMAQADTYLKMNGVTDKGTQDALKNKLSDGLWKTRIDTLLYDKPALADALFRANEKEIKDPELRLLLQAKTREAAQTVTAANEAQSIIDSTRGDLASAPPPGAPAANDQPARAMPVGNTGAQPNWDAGGNVEKQRAYDALRILHDELGTAKDEGDRASLQREIKAQEGRIAKQFGAAAVPTGQGTTPASMQMNPALAPATSGLPNSRDVAAQLPVIMGKVNKRADELYGRDTNNPDRAAFVKRLTSEVQARVSADVTQLNAIQREAQGKLIDAVAGIRTPGAGGGLVATGGQGTSPAPITSFAQIQASPELMRSWQMLDPQAKVSLQNLMDHNLRADDKGDMVLFRDLFNRIHLDPSDPNKINFYQQLVDPAVANRLSMPQIQQLRSELDRDETPGGRSLNQLRKAADKNVELYFKTNVMFTAQPERQIAATMQWNQDAAAKIDQYVKEGKGNQVRSLFMLDSKDSIVSPQYLQSYVNSTPATGLAEGAAAVKQGSTPANLVRAPATIKTPADAEAWIKTLPADATMFVDPAGQVRVIPGRQPGAPTKAAPAPLADLQVNPASADRSTWDKRQDGSEKGMGFLGLLKRPDGSVSSEISISTDKVGGKDFPLLVPTLTRQEVDQILAIPVNDPKFFDKVPRAAIAKAEAFAESRVAAGKPLFATPEESPGYTDTPTMNDQGKMVTPAPAAPPAPASPLTADRFEIIDGPDNVSDNLAVMKAARESAKSRLQLEMDARNPDLLLALKRAIEAVGGTMRGLGSALQGKIPTELERVYSGFEAIKQAGRVTRGDTDVLRQALKYGLLPPDDEKLAKGLLDRLGKKK